MFGGMPAYQIAMKYQGFFLGWVQKILSLGCLLYTSDAADERSSVDLGGRRTIKKKNHDGRRRIQQKY